MTTTEIMMTFNNAVSDDKEYTITELKKIMTDIYNSKTKNKKDKTEVKVKKEPTQYNIFVKEHYNEFKTKNPDATAPEVMKMIAVLWKNKDNTVKQDDEKKEEDVKQDDEKEEVKQDDEKEKVKQEVKKVVKKTTVKKVEDDNVSGNLPEIEKPKKRTVKK